MKPARFTWEWFEAEIQDVITRGVVLFLGWYFATRVMVPCYRWFMASGNDLSQQWQAVPFGILFTLVGIAVWGVFVVFMVDGFKKW